MISYAAAGDTWGIPGPTFLALYLGAVVVALIIVLIRRRSLTAGSTAAGYDRLTTQQAAYLSGGPDLAVYSALAALRSAGLIGTGPDRRPTVTAPLPPEAPPLDAAVYHAIAGHHTARNAKNETGVRHALDMLRAELERAGLALTEDERRAHKRSTLLLTALVALGVLRIVFGIAGDKPVGFLIPIVIVLGIVTLVLRSRNPWRTRAAGSALATLRSRYQYLSPAQAPAFATYGAAGVAMGVALYGTASFYAFDPAFAAEAEIQRQAAVSSGGGYVDGGSSWSSGDSGSSSSGGDSGGGGGGCGGGGCGG